MRNNCVIIIVLLILIYLVYITNKHANMAAPITSERIYNLSDNDFTNSLKHWKLNKKIYVPDMKWELNQTNTDFYNKYRDKQIYNTNEIGVLLNDKIYKYKWCMENNIPTNPVIFMNYQIDDNFTNFLKNIPNNNNYCVKPSHLSEGQLFCVVKNGKLKYDIGYNWIKDQEVPEWFDKFKAGYAITPSEVTDVMRFAGKCKALWEPIASGYRTLSPGVIVEELIDDPIEIKIVVGLGIPWGDKAYNTHFSEEDINAAHELCKVVAIKTGLLYTRIDIMKYKNKLFVNEITNNLGNDGFDNIYNQYFDKVLEYMNIQ